ncbi:hypothetical protein ACYCFK_18705 [Stutzerimonas stutzeri]
MRTIFLLLTLSGILTGCAAKLPADLELIPTNQSAIRFFYENFSKTGLFVRSNETLLIYSAIPVVDHNYQHLSNFNEIARLHCNSRDGYIPLGFTRLIDDDTFFRVCQDKKRKPIFFYFSGRRISHTDRASYLIAEKRPQVTDSELVTYLKSKGYFTNFPYW